MRTPEPHRFHRIRNIKPQYINTICNKIREKFKKEPEFIICLCGTSARYYEEFFKRCGVEKFEYFDYVLPTGIYCSLSFILVDKEEIENIKFLITLIVGSDISRSILSYEEFLFKKNENKRNTGYFYPNLRFWA